MKTFSRFLGFVLAVLLIMSIGVSASAGDGGSEVVRIVKTAHKADNSATSPAETFKFVFTPMTGTTPAGQEISGTRDIILDDGFDTNTAQIAFAGSEAYSYNDTTKDYTASLKIEEANSASFTPAEGTSEYYYEWLVNEEKGTNPDITYDSTRYLLVESINVSDGVVVSKNYAFYSEDGEEKYESMSFDNYHIKDTKLTVTNYVTDSAGSDVKSKSFKYTMTVNKPEICKDDVFEYRIYDDSGALQRSLSGSASYGEPFDFLLENGYSVFIRLPEGATYDIMQTGEKNYKPKATYNEQSGSEISSTTILKDYGDNLALPDEATEASIRVVNLYRDSEGAEKGTEIVFNNVKRDVSPTGIVISNLPFIVMVVIAGAGTALVVASKKRRHDED